MAINRDTEMNTSYVPGYSENWQGTDAEWKNLVNAYEKQKQESIARGLASDFSFGDFLKGAVKTLGPVMASAMLPGLSLFGPGLQGAIGTGALVGGTNAALTGGNIIKGAVTGGAMAGFGNILNTTISDIAGIPKDAADLAFMEIDATRLADSGITGQQLTDILAQSYPTVDPSILTNIAAEAVSGYVPAGTSIPTPSMGLPATGSLVGEGGNVLTTTGALGGANAGLGGLLAGAATGALGNLGIPSLPPAQTVEVTGQRPAESITPSMLSGLANLGTTAPVAPSLTPEQTVEVTAPRPTPVAPREPSLTALPAAALAGAASGLVSNAVKLPGEDSSFNTDATKALLSLLGGAGGLGISSSAASDVQRTLEQQAAAIAAANKAAQPGYQFSPIGITTRFGQATPKFDASGKLISYDYGATSDIASQRDQLLRLSQQALPSTTNTADVQANYIAQQQGLLAPSQQQELAALQAQMAATGRAGLGTGATTGAGGGAALAATNPQLAAYYNAMAQQNAQLAANAPTYAQNLLNAQIGTSGTLFGQAQGLESAAQQPLTMGAGLGSSITAGTTNASNAAQIAAAQAAQLQSEGALSAAGINTAGQRNLLTGLTNNTGVQNLLTTGLNWLTGK